MLEIQKLLKDNDIHEVKRILSSKNIKYTFEVSPLTNKTYLHLDYNIDASKTDTLVKECRGIVFEEETWDLVRFGFYRFMNIGEQGCDVQLLDNDQFEYEEKADGSIIILSYFDDRWIAGTRGAIFPISKLENNLTFESLFWKVSKIDPSTLDKNLCYIFELCSLDNRIVVPYEQSHIVLLSARNKTDWKEFTTEQLDELYNSSFKDNTCIRKPATYHFKSIKQCIDNSKKLSGFEEGFVIKKWNDNLGKYDRAKVKGPLYLDLHHVVTRYSIKNLVKLVLFNKKELLESFPEYLSTYNIVNELISNYTKQVDQIYIDVLEYSQRFEKDFRKKNFALKLQEYNKLIQNICFAMYTGKINSAFEYLSKKTEKNNIKQLITVLDIINRIDNKWVDIEEMNEDL